MRCNSFYGDGAQEILKGCSCGGRLFFYIKPKQLEEAKSVSVESSKEEKTEVERDILKMIGVDEPDKPVVLDFESINVLKPGKYQLDVVRLFKNEPLVFKLADGKYVIDIAETFDRMRKKR